MGFECFGDEIDWNSVINDIILTIWRIIRLKFESYWSFLMVFERFGDVIDWNSVIIDIISAIWRILLTEIRWLLIILDGFWTFLEM